MKQEEIYSQGVETKEEIHAPNIHRRKFLLKMGGAAAIAAAAAACTKSATSDSISAKPSMDSAHGFGTGDIAILNYAYLLEQLEAAFYTMATDNLYSGASSIEKIRLNQVKNHEVAHREFFKTALGSAAIPDQQFDFSSINFSDRTSVLTASQTFEDTGVSAYNGAGYLIEASKYLLIAGKIVSVEARHAAYFRDLLNPNSFADSSVVNMNGLDLIQPPRNVAAAISPYLTVQIDMKSFPFNV